MAPGSVRDIGLGHDAGRRNADQQLAGYAIARSITSCLLLAHIPAGDARGPGAQFVRVVVEGRRALNHDIAKRRRFVVYTETDARVMADVFGFDARMPGRE